MMDLKSVIVKIATYLELWVLVFANVIETKVKPPESQVKILRIKYRKHTMENLETWPNADEHYKLNFTWKLHSQKKRGSRRVWKMNDKKTL